MDINVSNLKGGYAVLSHKNGKYSVTVFRHNEARVTEIAHFYSETIRAAKQWREVNARLLIRM